MSRSTLATLGALLAVTATACSGPQNGQLQVLIRQDGGGAASVGVALSVATDGEVAPESIESLVIDVVRVDVKPFDVAEEDDSKWIRVPVDGDGTVDLMTLPPTGGEPVAEGAVPATSFKEVRLVCSSDGALTLTGPVTLPTGEVIGDDEPLTQSLRIPSCESSGLKIKGATFTVPEEGTGVAVVEVTTDATLGTVKWTGAGFQLSPVMKLK
ncbi:MAG: DUF4382 domain-containing protein [Gemmatimonadota bacterium]